MENRKRGKLWGRRRTGELTRETKEGDEVVEAAERSEDGQGKKEKSEGK